MSPDQRTCGAAVGLGPVSWVGWSRLDRLMTVAMVSMRLGRTDGTRADAHDPTGQTHHRSRQRTARTCAASKQRTPAPVEATTSYHAPRQVLPRPTTTCDEQPYTIVPNLSRRTSDRPLRRRRNVRPEPVAECSVPRGSSPSSTEDAPSSVLPATTDHSAASPGRYGDLLGHGQMGMRIPSAAAPSCDPIHLSLALHRETPANSRNRIKRGGSHQPKSVGGNDSPPTKKPMLLWHFWALRRRCAQKT